MKILASFEPAGDFPIANSWQTKGGIFVVKSITERNKIPKSLRVLDNVRSTMAYVEGGDVYYLTTNPTTQGTTDADWDIAIQSVPSEQTLLGTWKSDNTSPILQDDGYTGQSGDYYIVSNTPSDESITHAGLFGDNTVTVIDGDQIIYSDNKWIVVRNKTVITIPSEGTVTQYVADIAARNALNVFQGMRVIVNDAGDDPNVNSGITAEYIYQPNDAGADGQGYVRLNNPNLVQPPVNLETTESITIEEPGYYIYTGAGQATFTLPAIADVNKNDEIKIKNRSSDQSTLIVQTANAGEMWRIDEAADGTAVYPQDKNLILTAESYWTI